MNSLSADIATVQALRSDVALQLARYTQRMGATQIEAARQLGLPQPTLSKIINGRVSDVSLELLIRIAVRAGLFITLQTGRVPQEAGAFNSNSGTHSGSSRAFRSKLGDAARQSLVQSESRLTPSQRLQAFLEHNQLQSALHQAGRAAEAQRVRKALHKP
jgi:predicted XRE-type DNA-binding protein